MNHYYKLLLNRIIPSLCSHTHWQVAQSIPANQNLPKSMPAHALGLKKMIQNLIIKKDNRQVGNRL